MHQQRTTHTPDGQYEFELSEVGLLGAGAHGVVRAARHIPSGDFVAVKILPAAVLGSIAKELIAQAKMRHPNIVELYGTQVDLDNRRVYMLMELCRGGELFVRRRRTTARIAFFLRRSRGVICPCARG